MARRTKQDDQPPDTDGITIRGAFRLQITEDGEVVGDSGWQKNQITNMGFQQFLAGNLIAAAGSTARVGYIAIGSGTVPAVTTNALPGELGGSTNRQAIGANTQVSTGASVASAVMSATFPSNGAVTAATGNTLSNIGLYSASSATGLFAGATFASSPVSSNQAINVTYTVGFA